MARRQKTARTTTTTARRGVTAKSGSAKKTATKTAKPVLGRGHTNSASSNAARDRRFKAALQSDRAPPRGLVTLLDFVRYAVSAFNAAGVVVGHGTTDVVAEAAFIVCASLHITPDDFETFATARVTPDEAYAIIATIDQRVATRRPAAYLVNKMYMRGLPFFVDERVIVPRSYIGELLETHFGGDDQSLIADPRDVSRVLDLCTGSACLAILAARAFPEATIDAVDLSPDALDVAQRNVRNYGLGERISLHRGDLYAPVEGARYDIILSNPPYVDAEGMARLPHEFRHEPRMALDGGADGLDIIRRILAGAATHLNPGGGLLCEVGRGGPLLAEEYPSLPFLWLESEESEGEVFWLAAEALGTGS